MGRKRRRQGTTKLTAERLFRFGMRVLYILVLATALIAGSDWLLREGSFPVKRIRMTGAFEHVQQRRLAREIMPLVRGNLFALDLDAVRAKAETLPWVYRANVRRHWPHEVRIHITEHKLVARWGESTWLNQVAEVVAIDTGDRGYLPKLRGPDDMAPQVYARYSALNQILQPTGLRIKALAMTPRGNWRATLDNDVELVMSKKAALSEARRFVRSYPALRADKRRLRHIDLRYTNGFSVKWGANPRVATGFRNEG